MPSLEHRVSQLSETALFRRQERARRLIHTLATVEPGRIGLELKRERLILTRRLHVAAKEGRDGDLVAIQAALSRNRELMLRIAGFPLPARAKSERMHSARATPYSADAEVIEVLSPPDASDCMGRDESPRSNSWGSTTGSMDAMLFLPSA